ncbi:starvation-inducible DNA-binding protein [Kineococcus radiotolerans]|uniref:Starvation-inducible DNA-binding protein n=1 Tax=Kineococcus radiotolerans TaxID=131568 RepID=A0A7W4XWH5_KINRA|nr:DNA starvation/stationary phase protection protein [Kineococcus radiotolerans]MBB2900165.1 starvation-inducible DNA-binding protein [Kineococcus radiotolerans]
MAKESKKMKAEGVPLYTVPGLTPEQAAEIAAVLQDRLNALTDLHLTLKHVHWNVVGPHFVAVHEMLDPQVDAVREMADTTAERIATLGLSPYGTPGALVADRSWDDYSIGRAGAIEHLGALDLVYSGVIQDHRRAVEATGELDPITEDMLIAQSAQLEQYHWFVRAHLETSGGQLSTAGASSEVQARSQARAGAKRKTA